MTVDCESPPDSTDISDPDVSIGFVGTGCLMIVLLIIYYVAVFDPKLDPLRKPGQAMKNQDRPNAIDVAVLRRVRWALATLGCILAMSDIQIATGLAVLISGYHELPRMISAYHWMIIVYTAWFSSVAHLAALSHLRTYYANHPERFIWRLVLIFCVVTMLSVAMFINTPIKVKMDASDGTKLTDYRAICLFNESRLSNGSVPEIAMLADTIFSVSMLVAWVVITASWGLKQLLFVRAEGPEDENSWSFGQVAAVVLFISPLCLVFEQFFNPGPADTTDTRRSGATSTRSDDLLEIQASEPESLDARQEPIEWIRLVHITACWDAPSSRATVHLFVGFNFLLMVYAFNDYVVFRAFVKMMTWFFVYQPIQAALVLLLGMELEQTKLWAQSHALRRATVVALIIACLLGTIGIFLPSWEAPFTHLYVCPWEVVPVCLDYLMVGVVVLQFGVYLFIYMARNSSRALRSGG
ncbi:hypothetical protein CGCTS75_v011973 [Colletotrichum tropicale]|nr:hypothetical protein CGCTS75_v011973 [Colletotrichum tropicale]